jgi:hypothetical protein
MQDGEQIDSSALLQQPLEGKCDHTLDLFSMVPHIQQEDERGEGGGQKLQ